MLASTPTHFLIAVFAGWLNRQQQSVIEFLLEENQVLRSQLKGRRLSLTDGDRRLLAVKGKVLGRKLLAEAACLVTPETILAWASAFGCTEVDVSQTKSGEAADRRARSS